MNINIVLFFFIFMLLFLGFCGVSLVECKSAQCQGQVSLLTIHYSVYGEKWAKDTRVYLGLIGAWRGPEWVCYI